MHYRIFQIFLCANLFLFGTSSLVAQNLYIDNVIMIIDASGSMAQNMSGTSQRRIDLAKSAIKNVLRTIPQSTQVGLLVFGAKPNGWVYPLGSRDDQRLYEAIDSINAGGGTPLGFCLKVGADRLLKARQDQYGYGTYRLLVVTDGEANDPDLVDTYTPEIASRGIIVDAIGVDMVSDHTLATKAHSYRRANDPESLKSALQEVFAEVGKSTNDQSIEDAFEELRGIPSDAAMPIIKAWISSGNHPIGEEKTSLASNQHTPNNTTNTTNNTHSLPANPDDDESSIFLPLVIFAYVAYRIIRWKGKKKF